MADFVTLAAEHLRIKDFVPGTPVRVHRGRKKDGYLGVVYAPLDQSPLPGKLPVVIEGRLCYPCINQVELLT